MDPQIPEAVFALKKLGDVESNKEAVYSFQTNINNPKGSLILKNDKHLKLHSYQESPKKN